MRKSDVGENIYSEDEIIDALMIDPTANVSGATADVVLPKNLSEVLDNVPEFVLPSTISDVQAYDQQNQQQWLMPAEYKTFDIAKHVLELCNTDAELQRVGEELLMFQERGLFDLLRYLKFLVDTMEHHNIIYGVGRGSSVASYVLFLLKVHRINSMYYDLDIDEFLR